MSRNTLNIITSEEANSNDKLFIIDSNESSILAYKKDGDTIGLTEGSSHFRPIHCSELTERLKERGYNLMGTKFIKRTSGSLSSELCYDLSPSQNQIPVIITQQNNLDKSYKDDNGNFIRPLLDFSCCGSDLPIDEIQNEYNLIFDESNMNTRNEISFYSSSMSSINLIDDITEIELIKYNSDSYTNILNISELIYYNAKPGLTGLLDLTVEYSKAGQIYVRDLSFQAFKYLPTNDSDIPALDVNSYFTEINDDVQIEYLNNTIRVNPLRSDIDECIISRCTVTYGNL